MTNSSLVVPNGSLQLENGINLTAQRTSRIFDGTNTRIRLGVAHCTEFLIDLPDYIHTVHGRGPTGFSDVAPAAKAQLGPLPGGVVLSATAGLGFPTGTSRISGHRYNPYIQFPWSREIGGGWGLSGMFTQFWFSGQPNSNAISEVTFVVEREVGAHTACQVHLQFLATGNRDPRSRHRRQSRHGSRSQLASRGRKHHPRPLLSGRACRHQRGWGGGADSFFRQHHFEFSVTSEVMPGVERSFTSFGAAAEEATLSRIFAGVHFLFDLTTGQRLGSDVADFVVDNFLTARDRDDRTG